MLKSIRLHIFFAFVLCALTTFANPVDDITLVSVSPKAGELDVNLRTLESITLSFSTEIEVGPKALVTLEMPNGEILEAVPEANRFIKKNCIVAFPGYKPFNGTYKLTVKRWSVGDAEWIANREEGHSNPKIEVEWYITNGLSTDVDYDINPISALPVNESQFEYSTGQYLAQITLVFPNGTLLNPNSHIGLSSTEARFEQALTFSAVKGASNTTYTALITPIPTTSGNYNLIIPGGSFGDEDFINGNGGHANPPIDFLYVVSGAQNGEGDMLETLYYTFEPTSSKLEKDGDNYTFEINWSAIPAIDNTNIGKCKLLDEYGFEVDGVKLLLADMPNSKISEFNFTAELDDNRRYTILIAPEIFGDDKWVETEHKLGKTNPQLRHDFIPSQVTSGIEEVKVSETDAPRMVYTATGIMLYHDASEAQIQALAPGFYIIGSKKVIVK